MTDFRIILSLFFTTKSFPSQNNILKQWGSFFMQTPRHNNFFLTYNTVSADNRIGYDSPCANWGAFAY